MTTSLVETNLPAVINSEDQALLIAAKQEFAEIMEIVSNLVVTDDASMERATDLASTVKKGQKTLETLRKTITSPLNDEIKSVNNIFKGLKESGDSSVLKLTTQISARLKQKQRDAEKAALEAARQEEIERKEREDDLKELANLGDQGASQQLAVDKIREQEGERGISAPVRAVARGNAGSASMVKGKITVQVIDIKKVPARYLMVNEPAARSAFQNGIKQIEGLKITQEETVRVR